MPRPRVYKTEAIVLRHNPLGDTDKILTLYTPYLGKLRAVVKGVRRPTSKLAGHVEPLTRSAMMIARGQNLDIVTQSQTIDSFVSLRDDLLRTTQAIYSAELLDLFTVENDPTPPLYQLFMAALKALCSAPDGAIVLRHYELHLLGNLGYKPELYRCVSCHTPTSNIYRHISISGGGVVCIECRQVETSNRPISADALKGLRFLQRADLRSSQGMKATPALSRELEVTMRDYIRYTLEREVKSTAFLDTVRRHVREDALGPD